MAVPTATLRPRLSGTADDYGVKALVSIGDNVPFERRLAEAIAWCEPRADPADPGGSLRYDQFRPSVMGVSRADTVRQLLARRATWLERGRRRAAETATQVGSADPLDGGRLLVYYPDEQLADGAAEVESGGFFDIENVPAWDTWVGLYQDERDDDYLVSWVPRSLLDRRSGGLGEPGRVHSMALGYRSAPQDIHAVTRADQRAGGMTHACASVRRCTPTNSLRWWSTKTT